MIYVFAFKFSHLMLSSFLFSPHKLQLFPLAMSCHATPVTTEALFHKTCLFYLDKRTAKHFINALRVGEETCIDDSTS